MRTAQRRRPAAWDVLEGRALLSQINGTRTLAVIPIERVDAYAVMRHAQDLQQARTGKASVVFLGDSISDFWDDVWSNGPGAAVWRERIAPLGAANFGVSGDTTSNVLWRIANGELAGKPKLVVVEIGTNNLGFGQTAASTAAGITAVVDAVLEASPGSRVLLMGIFPRGYGSDDPLTRAAQEVNAKLARGVDGHRVRFLDIGQQFLDWDGTINTSLLPDGLHPNALGYEVWADALVGPIWQMLAGSPTAPREVDAHRVQFVDIGRQFRDEAGTIDKSLPRDGARSNALGHGLRADAPAGPIWRVLAGSPTAPREVDAHRVQFVDIGRQFRDGAGTIDTSLPADGPHPNVLGHKLPADAPVGATWQVLAGNPTALSAGTPGPATDPNAGLVLIALPPDAEGAGLAEVPGVGSGRSARKDHPTWRQPEALD